MPKLPPTLIGALKSRSAIPFIGAGVSRSVKTESGQPLFPTWRGLLLAAAQRLRDEGLTKKADRVQADVADDDYIHAAELARDALAGRPWFDFLKAQLDPSFDHARPATLDLARAVWTLGSPLVVTTNYDKVLRWASAQPHDLRHWTVSDRANLVDIQRDSIAQPVVWHLHGFIDRPEEIILTPDGYRTLYPSDTRIKVDYEAALVTLRYLLTAQTFLFIGFGMEDAIQQQIGWVRDTFAGAGGKHFVLTRAKDQDAMERALHGLSVQPVRFEDFGQPLLDLILELGREAASGGGLRPSKPLISRIEPDPRPYLEYLRNDSAFIEMRGLRLSVAEAPRFPIDDLYIPLIDELGAQPTGVAAGEIGGRTRRTLEESLAEPRLVILGDPGSGKTTFLRRIANAACTARLANASAPFPILLRISELSQWIETQERKDAPAQVPRLLAQQTRDLTVPLDEYWVEATLAKGPCLLLIDGLDEAPNEEARQTVSRLIEKAAHAWPNTRFVVTTRPKAYEEEVMLLGFHAARIGPLEPPAVRTFLDRWSAALIAENPARAKQHAAGLIQAVESRAEIRRIASNPVMLTALAVLHWNEKRMPEQRADLYESILTWLARSRQRRPGRLSAEDCLKVLQELAGAMHGHPEGRKVQADRDWASGSISTPIRRRRQTRLGVPERRGSGQRHRG